MRAGDGVASGNGRALRPLGRGVPLGTADDAPRVDLAADAGRAPALGLEIDPSEDPLRAFENAARILRAWRRLQPLLRALPVADDLDLGKQPVLLVRGANGPVPREILEWLSLLRFGAVRPVEAEEEAEAKSVAPEPAAKVEQPFDAIEEIKRRIVRMNPDVLEEIDGDRIRFRVARAVLATLERRDGRVVFRAGGAEAEEIEVADRDDVCHVMDKVFERFFGLSPTKRRMARAARRLERPPPEPLDERVEECASERREAVDAGDERR